MVQESCHTEVFLFVSGAPIFACHSSLHSYIQTSWDCCSRPDYTTLHHFTPITIHHIYKAYQLLKNCIFHPNTATLFGPFLFFLPLSLLPGVICLLSFHILMKIFDQKRYQFLSLQLPPLLLSASNMLCFYFRFSPIFLIFQVLRII